MQNVLEVLTTCVLSDCPRERGVPGRHVVMSREVAQFLRAFGSQHPVAVSRESIPYSLVVTHSNFRNVKDFILTHWSQ